jgi:sulfide:quinone oxidoreductase
MKVVIVGGGVAALETLIALRDLAGERVAVELVSPEASFTYRPMTVAQPFQRGHAASYDLAEIASEFGASFVQDAVAEVMPAARRVRCASGRELMYDRLVVALMTARQAWGMGIDDLRFTLVTPEARPLGMFGAAASDAVAELLEHHAIEFVGSSYPSVGHGYVVADPSGRRIDADRIVSLPGLDGPALPGLPADGNGFIPIDGHGRVLGWSGVYAAGDGTSFPIKQGGLATQQADAVAAAIAAEAGADVAPEPFRPVLRGMLLTGGDDRWLRNPVAGGDGEGQVSDQSLWWPPTKIAGRDLAAYLFGPDVDEEVRRQGHLEVEVPLAS